MKKLIFLLVLLCTFPGFLSQKTCEESIYTEAEKIALAKFRDEMKNDLYQDYMHRDEYLIHWLRAKNLNLDEAKEMLKRNLKWRQDEKIDELADEPFPQFEKAYKVDFKIRDRVDRAVVAVPYGASWDVRKAVIAGQLPNLLRYATKVFFEVPSKMSREIGLSNGSNCTQYYYISNLQGYNLRQQGCIRCLQFYLHYIQTYERYYPQHAREKILVNVPEIFNPVIDLSKPFWSGHLTEHLTFLNEDKTKWPKVFGKWFDLDEFPVIFGGKNKRRLSE